MRQSDAVTASGRTSTTTGRNLPVGDVDSWRMTKSSQVVFDAVAANAKSPPVALAHESLGEHQVLQASQLIMKIDCWARVQKLVVQKRGKSILIKDWKNKK